MTRQITREVVSAFNNNRPFHKSNSSVEVNCYGTTMYLWGNPIARKVGDRVQVSLAGWNTNTTRERLSALCNISKKNGVAHLNGKPINSTGWYDINY